MAQWMKLLWCEKSRAIALASATRFYARLAGRQNIIKEWLKVEKLSFIPSFPNVNFEVAPTIQMYKHENSHFWKVHTRIIPAKYITATKLLQLKRSKEKEWINPSMNLLHQTTRPVKRYHYLLLTSDHHCDNSSCDYH